MQRIFIWLLVLLIPVLRSSYTIDPDIYLKFISLSALLFIFIAHRFATRKKHPINSVSFKTPLTIVLLIFLSYSLVSLFISGNRTDGIFEWYMSFLTFVLVLVLISYFPLEMLRQELPKAFTLLSLVLISAGIVDLMPLVQHGNISVPADTYFITGLYGHRNLYAQILYFTFPYTLYAAWYSKGSLWKILGRISFCAALFLLIILSNRATWLALAIGLGSLLFFHVHFYFRKNRAIPFSPDFKTYKTIILIASATTFFSILFYFYYSNVSSVRSHTNDIVNFEKGSTKDHLLLWQKTLNIVKENPVLGRGLSTWKFDILKQGSAGLESENNFTFYQTPHNDFLWVWSEQGTPGLILYLLIFSLILYLLVKNISLSNNQEDFIFNNLTLILFVGYLVYSVFSFPKERVESNILFALITGVALMSYANAVKSKVSQSLIRTDKFVYIILAFILLGFFIGVSRFLAETHLKKALLAKTENNFPLIVQEIEKARGPFYQTDPTSTPLAWYAGSAYYNMADYNEALIELQKAYRTNPYHVHVLNNLASCYEMLGNHKSAIEYYKKAVAIAPNFEDVWLNMCAIYFNQKQLDEAYNALNQIPLSTTNPKFKPFVSAVLKSKIQLALKTPVTPQFHAAFAENASNEDWFLKVHRYLYTHKMTLEAFLKASPAI